MSNSLNPSHAPQRIEVVFLDGAEAPERLGEQESIAQGPERMPLVNRTQEQWDRLPRGIRATATFLGGAAASVLVLLGIGPNLSNGMPGSEVAGPTSSTSSLTDRARENAYAAITNANSESSLLQGKIEQAIASNSIVRGITIAPGTVTETTPGLTQTVVHRNPIVLEGSIEKSAIRAGHPLPDGLPYIASLEDYGIETTGSVIPTALGEGASTVTHETTVPMSPEITVDGRMIYLHEKEGDFKYYFVALNPTTEQPIHEPDGSIMVIGQDRQS